MNSKLTGFLKAAFGISKVMVPQIAAVESVVKGLKNGPDKKAAVIEGVLLAPEIAELVKGQEIVNQALFAQGVGKINDGYVDVMNSFKIR